MPKQGTMKNKSVTARQRIKEGSTTTALLRGKRGSGKSQFIIDHHKMNVEDEYQSLYNEPIDWNNIKVDKIQEASAGCLTCIIDMDLEGQEKLFERPAILPFEISDSIHKWPVTGSPQDTPDDEYVHRFDEAIEARKFYIRKLLDHKKQYPNNSKRRILAVEDCSNINDAVMDHFFFSTTKGKIRTFREHYEIVTGQRVFKGKAQGEKGVALFPLGQRDTFGPINANYIDYFRQCVEFKRDIGYHVYITARIGTAKDKDTGNTTEFTLGKTYLFEGFLELVLTFAKQTREVKVEKGKLKGQKMKESVFVIDTAGDSNKNRSSPDFWIYNEGVRKFYETLTKKNEEELNKKLGKVEDND